MEGLEAEKKKNELPLQELKENKMTLFALEHINGKFCAKLISKLNNKEAFSALQKAIKEPTIGNKLYAAYKTANFTLLAKAVAGRYKRQNKEAEKEATKNAIKMEGPLKERESISPTAARPSVTGMRPRSSSIISR